jgi:hypothetical protein
MQRFVQKNIETVDRSKATTYKSSCERGRAAWRLPYAMQVIDIDLPVNT